MKPQSSLNALAHPQPSPLLPMAPNQSNSFVNSILANWIDGILMLTEDGQCVESNSLARSICDRIAQDYPCINQLPEEIWKTCQVLIESRKDFPNHLIIAESELKLKQSHDHIRIRVRWFQLSHQADPHILVILEDQGYSNHNLAVTETIRYDLSPREADVWTLHRLGYTYQEIAAELHIALNTVKKHMKNTYAKQHLVSMLKESYPATLAS
ncbi:response regulator containing a -like receiver domain protein and an hth dna-binding domain protein [Leptolyngbya sp. Heron Island J]|uniref:helix-turn-helix transcriptional regulator n=1 Tax=Leptolyngbya sp. Heron Island J TaxID=1385935 RepID=UPI0003B9B56D|nr:LuxR family transcriptional regulator [Leptolyngbya sp. Heron Island J]ESA35281.1 response regulator containing a -like receiver domain protein and an hth dna-binding domain protein [Leptolyngbya sp. Heron Island J]